MNGFNLSAWAVKHRQFVLYLILAVAAAGLYAYLGMGRAEDPSFTIKTMVVHRPTGRGRRATRCSGRWPTRSRRSFRRRRTSTTCGRTRCPGWRWSRFKLRNDTPPKASARHLVPGAQEGGGHQAHAARGRDRARILDDEYGDVYVAVYAFTGADYTPAELKRIAEDARQRLLRVKDVSKVVLVGERPEKVFVEFSHKKLATLGVSPQQVFESLRRAERGDPGRERRDADRPGLRPGGRAVRRGREGQGRAGPRRREGVPGGRHRGRAARLRGPAGRSPCGTTGSRPSRWRSP